MGRVCRRLWLSVRVATSTTGCGQATKRSGVSVCALRQITKKSPKQDPLKMAASLTLRPLELAHEVLYGASLYRYRALDPQNGRHLAWLQETIQDDIVYLPNPRQ